MNKHTFWITAAVVFAAGVYLLVKHSRATAGAVKVEAAVADTSAAQDAAPAIQARHIDVDDYGLRVQ